MHIGQMSTSRFFKSADFPQPQMFTIARVTQYNTAQDNQPEEMKWCLEFEESEKALVLNKVNIELAAIACGSQETDEWIGKKIVLFNDPTVAFGGKLVGGVRIRAPKNQPKTAPAKPKATGVNAPMAGPAVDQDFNDDIPF